MKRLLHLVSSRVALVAVGLLLGATGAAVASKTVLNSSADVVQACVSPGRGLLRYSTNGHCYPRETPLTWNAQGERGPSDTYVAFTKSVRRSLGGEGTPVGTVIPLLHLDLPAGEFSVSASAVVLYTGGVGCYLHNSQILAPVEYPTLSYPSTTISPSLDYLTPALGSDTSGNVLAEASIVVSLAVPGGVDLDCTQVSADASYALVQIDDIRLVATATGALHVTERPPLNNG